MKPVVDSILRRLAWWFPRRLVLWCAVRVGAYATMGKYGDQIVSDLLFMDALERWDEESNT